MMVELCTELFHSPFRNVTTLSIDSPTWVHRNWNGRDGTEIFCCVVVGRLSPTLVRLLFNFQGEKIGVELLDFVDFCCIMD